MTKAKEGRPDDTGAAPASPDPLHELIILLDAARRMPPMELISAAPALGNQAAALVAAARADAMIAVTQDRDNGMTRAQLARHLSKSRAGITAVINRRLAALGKLPETSQPNGPTNARPDHPRAARRASRREP